MVLKKRAGGFNGSMKGDKSHQDDNIETSAHHLESNNNAPEVK
jgi:hypothetical protein